MYTLSAAKIAVTAILLGLGISHRLFDEEQHPVAQRPLGYAESTAGKRPRSQFSKKPQDNTTCPTYGESQWTGTAIVREGRELFYWFFDSRNDPDEDPVIIWISGGPGGSSMSDIFGGIGPCWLDKNATEAQPNPWSWNKNASLLFIDQPAGTGLSSLAIDFPVPTNEQDTAKDFLMYLNIFFNDIFPNSRKSRPIHLATSSYGGHFGPVYVQYILQAQHQGLVSFDGNIESLILVNSIFNWTANYFGVYDFLCKDRERTRLLNATACEYIADNLPEQERLGRKCDITYRSDICIKAFNHGIETIGAPIFDLVKSADLYLANINKKCKPSPHYPYCDDPDFANLTAFMNQGWVKKAVNKPPNFVYQHINMDIHRAFRENGAFMSPRTRELAYVLDAGVSVLAINGNLDLVVNTDGIKLAYESLHWTGQADYQAQKWRPLPDMIDATGSWKATSDGRLALVTVDQGGHGVPSYVRKGSLDILQTWMQGGWRM